VLTYTDGGPWLVAAYTVFEFVGATAMEVTVLPRVVEIGVQLAAWFVL
jgi:hypothetical protein